MDAATPPAAARITIAVAAVAAAVGAVVPERQSSRHLDHKAYLATVRLVRGGEGIYQASVDGLAAIGASVDQARALRQPWMFRGVGPGARQLAARLFFAVVVFGSTALAVPLVRVKPMALLVGAWAATAGVFYGIDAWLLFELWAVPLIIGACLAWVRRLDWVAAACCVGAVGRRETAVLLPSASSPPPSSSGGPVAVGGRAGHLGGDPRLHWGSPPTSSTEGRSACAARHRASRRSGG